MNLFRFAWIAIASFLFVVPAHAQQAPDIPPPSDDAAVWYLTALLQVERTLNGADDPEKQNNLATNTDEQDFELDKVGPVIDRLQDHLDYARRGATLDKCTWPVKLEEDGPYALLPNLTDMRRLARLLCVSAMVKRARGDLDGATDDCLAVMRLARHSASDGTVIGTLVQFSIEALATHTLTSQLHLYDRERLEALSKALSGLPAKVTLARAVQSERLYALWIERVLKQEGYAEIKRQFAELTPDGRGERVPPFPTEPELVKMIEDLNKTYDELERVMASPPQAFNEAKEAFDKRIEGSANILVRALMPALGAARYTEFAADSRIAMLQAMIAYRLGGEQAFIAVVDPYDGKPFTREVTDDGVVLTSRLIRSGNPWSHTFPAECAQPLD